MYTLLPIVTDMVYPELVDELGLTDRPYFVRRRNLMLLKDHVQKHWGEIYLIIVPPASLQWLDSIARIQVSNGQDPSIDLFCIHYAENPYVRQAWVGRGFEVASNIAEIVKWY